MKRKIILASASKRRSEILASCGIRHKVVSAGIKEIHSIRRPTSWVVSHNAKLKAESISKKYKNAVVIGADSLVRMGNHLIGKPATESQAKAFLKKFSGKRIEVFTGLFLADTCSGKSAGGYEKSSLYVQKMGGKDIDKYFKLLGPYDKAGGFSIEGVGSILFDDIRGSYFNILGLPMIKLAELFKKIGLDIADFIE